MQLEMSVSTAVKVGLMIENLNLKNFAYVLKHLQAF